MKPYKFSIIIPAYNEEVLISKTLARLFEDNSLNNIELLVICNACEDKTHFEVISFIKENALLLKKNKIDLSVLETVKASKTNALNMGINNSQGFVKVLMDADIQICGKDINILVDELYIKKLKAVSPQIEFSFDNSNFLVRQYYRVASLSFYNIHSRLSNVIALSEDGIKRVSPLPEVIADDEYIRRQFTPNEVAVSQHCSLIFICAKNLTNLLQVLTRVERGNIQLKRRYSALTTNSRNGYNQPPVLCLPTFFFN